MLAADRSSHGRSSQRDLLKNSCSTKYEAQCVVKIFRKYPWTSSFLLKLHACYQVKRTFDLQKNVNCIEYSTLVGRRDSKSMASLFSYFDSGRK